MLWPILVNHKVLEENLPLCDIIGSLIFVFYLIMIKL